MEVAGAQPVGTSHGAQRPGAPRPTPRRWRTYRPEDLSIRAPPEDASEAEAEAPGQAGAQLTTCKCC